MNKTFVLAWVFLMLTGNFLVLKTVNAAHNGAGKNTGKLLAIKSVQDTTDKLRTYKVKLGGGKDKQVQLTMFNANVKIIGYNGDDVVVETKSYNPPKRAEGLKPLYSQTEDNTNLGLSVVKEGNAVIINKASRTDARYFIKIPKNASIIYKETNYSGDNLSIADVDGEIELKLKSSNITLTNVSGPVIANTVSGNIHATFSSLDQSKPSAIAAVSGTVDLTLPPNTKASLKLKSSQGEIYTDFDVNIKKDATKNSKDDCNCGGNTIDGQINGSGVELSVTSISSDLFIRKKK